ncbi:MAG: T9SS type A sorting domain-containing protein [Bacteroidota bacterium]
MTKIYFLLLFLINSVITLAQCSHTVRLTDTYGDGWNGGIIKVQVNGTDILTNLGPTFTSGIGPINFTFNASTSDVIKIIETNAGSFPTEMRVEVLDGGGTTIISSHDPQTGSGTSGTGNCPPPMSITAATVIQSSAANTAKCALNQQIVCLQITTTGITSAKTVTQVQTNFSGTAGVSALSNVDIYYTGTSSTFATTTLFGSNASPSTSTYNINGSQVLSAGINYFWLVYDLNNSGTVGTIIDALITQFTASAVNYTSGSSPNISTTNPAGTSTLTICTAPGGIFTGLETWVKADGGIINQASGGTPIIANGTPAINSASTSYNYNPYIDFTAPAGVYTANGADANRQFLKLSGFNGIVGLDYRSLFWTGNMTDLTRANTHSACVDDVTHSAPTSTLHGHNSGSNAAVNDPAYDVNDFGSSAGAGTWKRNGTTLVNAEVHTTSKQIISALSSAGGGTTLNRFFGGQRDHSSNGFMGSGRDWRGPAAELIGFTTKITATERQKVHSYLAIKYGITLAENYLSTSTGTIYTSTAPYNLNIIGIGRDDIEGLTQKQSHQNDDTVRIYMNTIAASNNANPATFSSDISYVVQGSDNRKLCTTSSAMSEVPTGLTSCALTSRLEREWKVTRTNMSQNYNMDVKLNACGAPGSVNVAHLRFLVDDDGNFGNGGTQCYYNGDGTGLVFTYSNPTITVSNISTTHIPNNVTRYITIASINPGTPLPIELIFFDTKLNKQETVDLSWETNSERDNDYFTIDKSIDGVNWENLGTLKGAGTTTISQAYYLEDLNPILGVNYYRLKQTDFDGKVNEVGIRAIEINSKELFVLSPNPGKNLVAISGKDLNEYTIEIFNNLGEKVDVNSHLSNPSKAEIDTQHLTSGIYFVSLSSNNLNQVLKLIIEN